MILLAGFWLNKYPSFIDWLKYLSPYKYAFDASRKIMFDRDIPCDGSSALGKLCDGVNFVSTDELFQINNAQGTLLFNVGMLILMILAFRCAAYTILWMAMGDRCI
eukprot:4537035-Ditylum_brightwellii.AAC.1